MASAAPYIAWRRIPRSVFVALLAVALFAGAARVIYEFQPPAARTAQQMPSQPAAPIATGTPFVYEFKDPGILHESASPDTSSSPYWWVDSGGKLIVENGVGKTLQGELPASDPWRERYNRTSRADTANGAYPQNLFRLLARSQWDNVRVESSFLITADNFATTTNRNESNGILLLSRYKNGDNTYYAGLRVDGHAVIKKKVNGTYTTLAEKQIYKGTYSRTVNKTLLPHNEWLTLRMDTVTSNSSVTITLSQKDTDGTWRKLLSAEDTQNPIKGTYPVGIRTDFMDVEFDNFKAEKI